MNRRGFLSSLASLPVAAAAIAAAPKRVDFTGVLHHNVQANPERTIQMARYQWGSFHDGFDEAGYAPADLEALLRENMQTLKRGFEENFDLMVYRSA